MRTLSLAIIIYLLFSTSDLKAFGLSIPYVQKEDQGFIFFLSIKKFPMQEVILSLKEQRHEVLLIIEANLYEKRLLLPDLPIKKVVYFKKAYFELRENAYKVDTEKYSLTFYSAEDTANFLAKSEPYYFPFSDPLYDKHFLLIKATLSYKSHLNSKLRYTTKLHTYIRNAETTYKFSKD